MFTLAPVTHTFAGTCPETRPGTKAAPIKLCIRCAIVVACCLPLTAWSSQVTRPIFQCTDANGHQLFTDSGCAGQQPYEPPAESFTHFPPLSAAELKRLKQLSERTVKASEQRRLRLHKRQQALAEQAVEAEQACNRARAELADIAAQRRKGYSIKQSEKLAAAERKYNAAKRRYC